MPELASPEMYSLPFKPGLRTLELGGGSQPMFHPNIDVRQVPGVDYVADFNEPLMVPSDSVDQLFCKFCIEHISWKTVRKFISEVHRILAPGGIAVFITANTYEQVKKLAETPAWNDDLVCMLFGGQGLEQDADVHRCAMSPAWSTRLFKEAGFCEVKTFPLPTCNTDMIIEARKSQAVVIYGLPTLDSAS